MTRRTAMVLTFALTAGLGAGPLLAHPGHDHKVLGTVTMAAADHVMLKDKAGKEVTVHLTKDTKVLIAKKPATVADIKVGQRIVVTAESVKEKTGEKLMAKTIELGPPPTSR